MERTISQPKVVIIGAGVGGLSSAIALKSRLGFENFAIYEKGDEVGGCWRANIYPGCSSDVDIHWYSLSSDLNPNWNKSHGLQPEIQDYWIALAKKYGLYSRLVFNTKVISAEWNIAQNHYEIVISAVGILDIPRIPYDIPGVDTFKGVWFHSVAWPRELDLRYKRVAIIGNASSGVQFVPALAADPNIHIVNFIRTPVWFNTRSHIPYSDAAKWAFANIPFVMWLHRASIMFQFDWPLMRPPSPAGHERYRQALRQYILDSTPSKYHDHLIPTHPPGCKRTVADSGYLKSLSLPNVALNFDGIEQIVETGILTKKGAVLPFDVIIYATGFIGDQYPVDVKGLNGTSIQEYYDAHGGPTAYLGTTIPDIPNFYMLAGPNTGTPASTLFMEEVQISYLIQLVKPILDGLASAFVVKADVTDAYNDKLQERLLHSVQMQCHSWQRTGGRGKVFNSFPYAVTIYWWWLWRPNWAHYIAIDGQKWARTRTVVRVLRVLGASACVLLLLAYARRPALLRLAYEWLGARKSNHFELAQKIRNYIM